MASSDLNHQELKSQLSTRLAKNEKEDDPRNVGTQTLTSSLFWLSNLFQERNTPFKPRVHHDES